MEFTATNIRLPRRVLEELKVLAARRRKSLAQLIREAVEQVYSLGEAPLDPKKDPFYKLVGAWESGIADGSVNHDRDIYGAKD